ncbi:MAG: helix-turn-helix domain-containing protein [Bacteroidales bacterium]|nr:helix-turn-helix domain-containing protein [Bacteroidales bacterium]
MAIISLVGSVQALFYLLLFQSKPKKSLSDYLLILFTLLLGAIFFDQYLRNTNFYQLHPEYWGITYCFPIITAPLLYFYVVLITQPEQKFKSWFWLLTIPFFVFLTYYLANYYFLPIDKKTAFFHLATTKPWAMIYAGEFFLVLSGPVYSVLGLFRLKRHIKNIEGNFSYTTGIDLIWLKTILIAIIAVNVIGVLLNVLSDIYPLFTYQTSDNIMHSLNVLLIFFIGYYGFKQALIYPAGKAKPDQMQKEQFAEIQLLGNSETTPKYTKSGLQKNEVDIYYSSLIQLIDSEKLFLDSRLSIKTIADKLGMSVNHLSQVINQQSGKNFFKFINEYRVEEAKKLLLDQSNQKYTILAIAYDCGFNSKSSFNTIFKQYTGKTPSDFIENSKN